MRRIGVIACCVVLSAKALAQTPPPMLSRAAWNAREPNASMKPQTPTRITIHHTAARQRADRTLAQKMLALQNFSQTRWPDVPYHFYISVNGELAEGRAIGFVGDTNTQYDPKGHILIVLEGNFEEEEVSDAQWSMLVKTVDWLAARYHIAPAKLSGHSTFAKTQCPGRNLDALLPKLRATKARP